MDTLKYLESELIELRKMAVNAKQDLLAYLLEMAVVEAREQIKKQRLKA